jgi:hypothetical protein
MIGSLDIWKSERLTVDEGMACFSVMTLESLLEGLVRGSQVCYDGCGIVTDFRIF